MSRSDHDAASAATFAQVLRRRAAETPHRQAYRFLGDGEHETATVTYQELARRVERAAALLRRRVAPGQRALLLYPPGIEYIEGLLACFHAGVVAVPVYPPDPARAGRTLPRIQAIAADAGATVALTTAAVLPLIESALALAPALRALTWLATDTAPAGEPGQIEPWSGDGPALIQYTSGSTGTPRGVILGHDNLLANSTLIQRAFDYGPDPVGVIWLPPYHDMGLIGGILQPLFHGMPVVLMPPLAFLQRPLRWLAAIARYRATVSGGPNFAYDLCVRKVAPAQRQALDLRCWEVAFTGAEPVRAGTIARFAEAFASAGFRKQAFYPCYGLAEATLIVSGGAKDAPPVVAALDRVALARGQATRADASQGHDEDRSDARVEARGEDRSEARGEDRSDARDDNRSVALVGCGRPLPGLEVRIVDPEAHTPCAPGLVGEIWVRGASVARGYWGRAGDTEHGFGARLAGSPESYLRTGDLGFVLDGELFVTGRRKDLVIVRGRNLYPQDLEWTVETSHPGLRPGCGAAFAVDMEGEERLVVVHELDAPAEAGPAVIGGIRQALAQEHQVVPWAIVLLRPRTIAKTSSGKIQRHACRDGFLAGTLDVVCQWRAEAHDEAHHSSPDAAHATAHDPPPDEAHATTHNQSPDAAPDAASAEAGAGPAPAVGSPAAAQDSAAWLAARVARLAGMRPGEVDMDRALAWYGLDSMRTIELGHQIEIERGAMLSPADLHACPSLAELARRIDASRARAVDADEPADALALADAPAPADAPARAVTQELPLGHGQRAIWLHQQLAPESRAYHLVRALRIRGGPERRPVSPTERNRAVANSARRDEGAGYPPATEEQRSDAPQIRDFATEGRPADALDPAALGAALQALVDRHPALRTTFAWKDGAPVQRIAPRARAAFTIEDASGWTEAARQERLMREAHQGFDLEHGPLFRALLLADTAGEHLLLLAVHHLISDLWSVELALHELGVLYAAACRRGPAGPAGEPSGAHDGALASADDGVLSGPDDGDLADALPAPGLDLAAHLRHQAARLAGAEGERQWRYWQDRLAAAPPALALPGSGPRPAVPGAPGACLHLSLGPERTRRIHALARAHQVTPFTLLAAAFTALLQRYTGQSDLVIGMPTAGRQGAAAARALGCFVNPLPLRVDMSGDPGFLDHLAHVRRRVHEALEHPDLPLPVLVERLRPARVPGRPPLFQVMLALHSPRPGADPGLAALALGMPGATLALAGLRADIVPVALDAAQFDMTLALGEVDGALAATFEYRQDLLDQAMVQRLADSLCVLLDGALAAPDTRLSALPLLPAAERRRILAALSKGPEAPPAPDDSLHGLFAAQVRERPRTPALVWGEETLTYGALGARARDLAHALRGAGVAAGSVIGVHARSPVATVIGMLAALEADGAYLPLDPAYPRERLCFMLDDARAAALITEHALRDSLPWRGPVLCADAGADTREPRQSTDAGTGEPREGADAGEDTDAGEPRARLPEPGPGADAALAYCIYTSGSTGQPKGVLGTHGAVVSLLRDLARRRPVAAGSAYSAWTSPSFDVSVYEIFSALTSGGTLYPVPEEVRIDPRRLCAWLRAHQVRSAFLPAFVLPHLRDWLAQGNGPLALERLLVGVEPIPHALLAELAGRIPGVTILNGYGPTEATVCATIFEVAAGQAPAGPAPVGRPVHDTVAYVLDHHGEPVPVGVTGEVYLGGVCVTRGYAHRPALTRERFLDDPHGLAPGGRVYRTGDLARWREDGNLELAGRIDHQIKIRGFRVEPGEIEAVLTGHPDVAEAAVVARPGAGGDAALVAYLVPRPGAACPLDALHARLRASLPGHMVPDALVPLDALPLTPAGKLDRQALPAPHAPARAARDHAPAPPRGRTEEILARILGRALGGAQVGIHDHFFDDLGGSSMILIEVCAEASRALGVDIPVIRFFEHPTIAALARNLDGTAPDTAARPSIRSEQERATSRRQAIRSRRNRGRNSHE